MIDPNYIHQRDVSTILTNLQADVNNVREKYAENPNDPQLAIELQTLIDNADRDLRLKTQAIVRARLSQSRLLPIQSKSIPIPELPPRSQSAAGAGPPLPPLQPAPSDYEPINPHKRGVQNKNAHPPQPIHPIVHEKHSKRLTTPVAKDKIGRSRRIPQLKETLPRVDRHDPLATPPPISEKLINAFGLEQLNETGLIQNSDIKKHLEGIVTVAPYTYELPPVPLSVTPNYVLDTSAQNITEEEAMPNTESTSIKPAEENCEQKEDKSDNLAESSKSIGSSDSESDITKMSMKFFLINGIPDEDSVGFNNFRRSCYSLSETIDIYLDLLRRFCENQGLKKQQIDGQKLIEIATNYDPDEVSDDRLIGCLSGELKKIRKAGRFGFGFIGEFAEKKAATAIQSIWRGFTARRMFRLIKKTSSAAKRIQNWYKQRIESHEFRQSMREAKKERYQAFLELQGSDFYYPNQPHLLLHIINGHLPSELGRIQVLKTNPNSKLVIFSRFPLPTFISSYLKDHIENQEKLVFVVPRQKLPYTLPIEDVLASDSRLMKYIQEIANEMPIYFVPNRMRDSLIDASSFMESFLISPLPKILANVTGLKNNRQFLSNCCQNMFITAPNEVHNKEELCTALANLSLENLNTQQWMIKTNSNKFGWIDTNEISLLERVKKNASIMTQDDLNDPTFRNLLVKTISDELNVITETISTINKSDLLKEVYEDGAFVQAAPQDVKSRPSVSLFVMTKKKKVRKVQNPEKREEMPKENKTEEAQQTENSNENKDLQQDKAEASEKIQNEAELNKENDNKEVDAENKCENNNLDKNGEEDEDEYEYEGEVHITGTWENLYISEFEPFATIHPAFIVKPEKLCKHTMKYANDLIKKNLIGTSVIDFWFSTHSNKERITPDEITFTATERYLPQMLSENVCNLTFNEKTLKMGKYTYVQERLVLPYAISIDELNSKCIKNGIKINKNVFFIPDLQEEITIGLVAVANSPEMLINIVYETFCILTEKVFDLKNDPKALLFSYCTAIEFIKEQIDSEGSIRSTVYMKKMRIKVVEDQIKPLLFHYDELNKKNRSDDESSSPETPKIEDDYKITEISNEVKTNTVKIFDANYVPEGRRSLITTPIDADGREKKLITPSDEDITEPNSAKNIENIVKEDLPDAPAGANIPEDDSIESNSNQQPTKIEGDDDEILTEEAQTPRSDDDE
ncbi:hypothetical protein M9Y10_002021 [Tritrichomonas musculus]|uniref:IQ calmodulin-binding motif family protein n=1 Tax=Tritrichomonas musculus TaxID=1915356 RepID=A0ABR2L8M0_9EUKA